MKRRAEQRATRGHVSQGNEHAESAYDCPGVPTSVRVSLYAPLTCVVYVAPQIRCHPRLLLDCRSDQIARHNQRTAGTLPLALGGGCNNDNEADGPP